MLSTVLAHVGEPLAPHDLWRAWNTDVLVIAGLVIVAVAYWRGRGPATSRVRSTAFWVAVFAVAVAIVSPLDAMAASLASAHMVQHVLLMLVAAPLFALAAPGSALLWGGPARVRRGLGVARRRLGMTRHRVRALRHPVVVWLLHVTTLWLWHSAVLYDAAVRHEPVHAIEHMMFLATGVLFWRVVVGARTAPASSYGRGVALVFTMALQGVLLSALLTFAGAPWYAAYRNTTGAWGLDPLTDQQLAGVIMWVPASFIYVSVALLLLGAWIRHSDDPAGDTRPAVIAQPARAPELP